VIRRRRRQVGVTERRGVLRRLAPVLAVLLALATLGVVAYGVWLYTGRGGDPPDEEEVAEAAARVEDAVEPGALDEVRTAIGEIHETLNNRIGYGSLDDVDYGTFGREVAVPARRRLVGVVEQVDDAALRRDLEAVRALLRAEPERLKYAHRVLHDLDHFAFNPENSSKEYWAATVLLEGRDNPAQRYLAGAGGE
jgi:hypothetical protein